MQQASALFRVKGREMNRLVVSWLLVGCCVTVLSAPLHAQEPDGRLIIWDVTLIDGTGAPPTPRMAVVVQFGTIQAIRPIRDFRVPRGAQVIDGRNLYLIPGLWDMHVHMTTRPANPVGAGSTANSRYFLPIFVAFGITGVRDMSGDLGLLVAWRDSVSRGLLLGPRMVVTGGKLGGANPTVPGAPFPLQTEAGVRRAVQLLKAGGADFVKIDNLPAEFMAALADECRKQNLPFVGHVTETMNVAEASRLGQRTIEHLDYFALSLSSEEATIRRQMERQESWWVRGLYRLGLSSRDRDRLDLQRRTLETWNSQRARELYAQLARDSTWQVPTLNGVRAAQMVKEPWFYASDQQGYLPPPRRGQQPTFWSQDAGLASRLFTRQLEMVGDMYRAGVPIMAGTDTPGYDRVPAFSLAEELALLVRAGLSPMAALQTATRNPARFLGLEDSLGTIEPGKIADLVLLDANPMLDIRNVHRVHSVILRGSYLSPRELSSLRSAVQVQVAAWRDSARAMELSQSR
jgi:imidazolonepropionase-like amidohydrolase